MAKLRDVAAKVEQESKRKLARGHVDLALPLYEGRYAARFGVLSKERLDEFEKLVERAERESVSRDEADEVAADFLADACRVIVAKTGEKWEPLQHDDERPVRFDAEFAEALGLELDEQSGAAVVRAVFTTDTGELNRSALQGLAIRVVTWASDTTQKVHGEVAGG